MVKVSKLISEWLTFRFIFKSISFISDLTSLSLTFERITYEGKEKDRSRYTSELGF